MRRLVRERCDSLVRIPMHTRMNSLNVATAGAILLAYRWDHCVASYGQREVGESVTEANFSLTKHVFFFTISTYSFCELAYGHVCTADVAQR